MTIADFLSDFPTIDQNPIGAPIAPTAILHFFCRGVGFSYWSFLI
jgi:hypothetical protein